MCLHVRQHSSIGASFNHSFEQDLIHFGGWGSSMAFGVGGRLVSAQSSPAQWGTGYGGVVESRGWGVGCRVYSIGLTRGYTRCLV